MNAVAVDLERDESDGVGVVELGHDRAADASFVMELGKRDGVSGEDLREQGFDAAVGSEIAQDSGLEQAAQHAYAAAALAGVSTADGHDPVSEPLLHAARDEGRRGDRSEVDERSGGAGHRDAALDADVRGSQVGSAVGYDARAARSSRGRATDLDDRRAEPVHAPQAHSGAVRSGGARAEGEGGGEEPALPGRRVLSAAVHADVNAVPGAGVDSVVHLPRGHSRRPSLLEADEPVLGSHEGADARVGSGQRGRGERGRFSVFCGV